MNAPGPQAAEEDPAAVLNRFPIALKVFVAPLAVTVLLLASIVVSLIALETQQKAFRKVVAGPLETSTTTTKLLLAIAEVHNNVIRYAQLRPKLAEGDRLLNDLARSIDDGYSRIDRLFAEIKSSTAGSGEGDAVVNISDFLIIHRAVARRIVTGESTGTVAVSTLLAHYQQLQSYVVELAGRTLASAQGTAAAAATQVNNFTRYLAIGSLAALLFAILLTFYIGRAIARPITEMIGALNRIVAGDFQVSVAGVERRDEVGDMARAVDRFSSVSRALQVREQSLREAHAKLEATSRHKSEFLANMSHELRTPLNAIIGFSEVLTERYFGELTPKQEEYVKDIHGSGKHLLSLINDILDLSKIEAGRMELELTDFDLKSALENARTLLKERAQRHNIALRLEVPPELASIRADERKVKQIVVNLLSNAVKFTPDGGTISISARRNGDLVEVCVADSGSGIAPEDQAAVFEEFRQVGRDTQRKAEGTGLGLPLAKRFVELHGGQIRLDSALGKGSKFTVSLPLSPAA